MIVCTPEEICAWYEQTPIFNCIKDQDIMLILNGTFTIWLFIVSFSMSLIFLLLALGKIDDE